MKQPSYSCNHSPIATKYTLDGGQTGNYSLELCQDCDDKEDLRFIIRKEKIGDIAR